MKKVLAEIKDLELRLAGWGYDHNESPVKNMKWQHAQISGDPDRGKAKMEERIDANNSKDWFSKMTKEDQQEYIRLHPKSKYAK